MRQMIVFGVSLDLGSGSPVVLLREQDGATILPLWIGHPEATAIISVLQGVEMPRPLTHDLTISVIESLGGQLIRAAIVESQESIFYARLTIERDGEEIEIDARPSDAIALALRAEAPFYVSEEILNAAGMQFEREPESDEAVVDEFRHFLDNVDPEEFRHSG
jgi:hypothetical protein